MQLSEAIRKAMGRLTQTEVAAAMSELGPAVNQSKVSRWVTGAGEPSFEELARLEQVCNRPRGFILAAAGFAKAMTVPEVIAIDPALDDQARRMLLGAYEVAVKAVAEDPRSDL